MPRSKKTEKFRSKMHVPFGKNGTNAIRYYLKTVMMREGPHKKVRQYAVVVPTRRVSQMAFCERLEAENRKYSAGEYYMIIDQIIEALTYDLRCGNSVSFVKLGLFSPSIAGAFNPAEFRGIAAGHALRGTLRVSAVFNDRLNKGATLKLMDALPAHIRVSDVAYSMASEAMCERYGGDPVCVGGVRCAAHQIVLDGSFRNLPAQGVAEIERLGTNGVAFDDPIPIPAAPLTPPTHKSQRKTLLSLDVSSVSTRLLPGTPWRLRLYSGTEEPQVFDFKVEG